MAYNPFVPVSNISQDLRPNLFADVGGAVMNQGVISQYELYKPNELIQVFERHKKSISWRMILKSMGFSRGTAAPTTGHYEYPWRKNLVTFGAIITASTGPGTDVVVEIDPLDMFNTNLTANGVAVQASFARERDILEFYDGNQAIIIAKDTSVTPHQLTLQPLDSAVDFATSVNTNEGYFVVGNAWGEGEGLPAGRVPRIIEYKNTFQIVKESAAATGSSLTNEMYFNPTPGVSGTYFLQVTETAMENFECAPRPYARIWSSNQ